MTARVHRLANTPPTGDPSSNKKQTLCGRYLTSEYYTKVPALVTCVICNMAASSERTKQQQRI